MSARGDRQRQVEWALLGSILHDSSQINAIDTVPEDFVGGAAREVFTACVTQAQSGMAFDAVTLADHLSRKTGRDYTSYVLDVLCDSFASSNFRQYARMLREMRQEREARAIAKQLLEQLDGGGVRAIDEAIRALMALQAKQGRRWTFSVQELAQKAIEYVEEACEDGLHVGLSTGLTDLDAKMGGLHPGDLTVVGARPSMGKTAFLLNLAAGAGAPVGVVSAEQGHEQIGLRLLAQAGRVNAHRMRLGTLDDADWPRITSGLAAMSEMRLWVHDEPRPHIHTVARLARQWVHEYQIQALYVDYLQRLKAGGKKSERWDMVSEAIVSLKELARELNIPVVVLAQVNREVDKRQDKRPGVADLLLSGTIEAEADLIWLLYRDDVYDPESDDAGIMEVNVAKNRHGPIGQIKVAWLKESMRVEDLAKPDAGGAYCQDRFA